MKNINSNCFLFNAKPDHINEFIKLSDEFMKNSIRYKYKNAKDKFLSQIEYWDDDKKYIAYHFYKKSGNNILGKILLESNNKGFNEKLDTIYES